MVEHQLPKLTVRVRFSSPAPPISVVYQRSARSHDSVQDPWVCARCGTEWHAQDSLRHARGTKECPIRPSYPQTEVPRESQPTWFPTQRDRGHTVEVVRSVPRNHASTLPIPEPLAVSRPQVHRAFLRAERGIRGRVDVILYASARAVPSVYALLTARPPSSTRSVAGPGAGRERWWSADRCLSSDWFDIGDQRLRSRSSAEIVRELLSLSTESALPDHGIALALLRLPSRRGPSHRRSSALHTGRTRPSTSSLHRPTIDIASSPVPINGPNASSRGAPLGTERWEGRRSRSTSTSAAMAAFTRGSSQPPHMGEIRAHPLQQRAGSSHMLIPAG
jgi:hypothetical protein